MFSKYQNDFRSYNCNIYGSKSSKSQLHHKKHYFFHCCEVRALHMTNLKIFKYLLRYPNLTITCKDTFFLLLRGEIGGSASKTLEFDLSYMRKKFFYLMHFLCDLEINKVRILHTGL